MMNIGIIGTGRVGSAIGLRLANLDYKISYGSRNPSSRKMLDILQQSAGNAKALSIKETILKSDVVILAIPWEKAKEVVQSSNNWNGKILIDCTNPLKADLSGLAVEHNTSAAEQIAQWAKGADVIKAFNSVGSQVMTHPQFGSEKAVLFICGDKDKSKEIVTKIGEEMGFDVVDTGVLWTARYLEQMAIFWIHMAFNQGLGADFALKILKR
jgi:8-hydroxy-5-deazaflavin:NADPH oxidoreductase